MCFETKSGNVISDYVLCLREIPIQKTFCTF
jgi:hypothetical protein